jgi:hypothetical protein
MTCDECLSILATTAVSELGQSSRALRHGDTCQDCARIITLVKNGEHDLAYALADASSRLPAGHVAADAIRLARRRHVKRLITASLSVVAAITVWVTWLQVIEPALQKTAVIAGTNLRTETIALKCLSPTQAGDLISPYVRSSGSAYYPGKGGLDVITVRATPKELQEVKRMVGQFDKSQGSACQIVRDHQVAPAPK